MYHQLRLKVTANVCNPSSSGACWCCHDNDDDNHLLGRQKCSSSNT